MNTKKLLSYFIVILTIVSLSCEFLGDIPHTSDLKMLENFRKNESKFEDLRAMIRQDEQKIGKEFFRIDEGWTAPEDLGKFGIDQKRVDEYRRRFKELNIPRGFIAYGEGDFYIFTSSTQGLGVSGSSKDYVWSKNKPQNIIEGNIENYVENHSKEIDYPVYRHIKGNWYIGYYAD